MDTASNQSGDILDHGFVVRKSSNKYHIRGIEDLPLSKMELIIFLKQQTTSIEDIGLMFTYFELDKANEAHFGVLGEFLFATNYIPPSRQ